MKKVKRIYLLIILIFICFYSHLTLAQSNRNPNLNDVLTLKINGNSYQDNLYIAFNQNATQGYDGQYDVLKLFGIYAAPQFFSIVFDTINLSINSVPYPVGNYTVQLGLQLGKDTSYTITATGADSFINFPMVLLEDTKTMSFINLIQQPIYTFNGLTSDSLKRFKVHFSNSTNIYSVYNSQIQIFTFCNTLYVNTLCDEKIQSVEITDILGRKLKDFRVNNENNFSNNLQMKPSTYLINITTNKSKYSKKIIIN